MSSKFSLIFSWLLWTEVFCELVDPKIIIVKLCLYSIESNHKLKFDKKL